MLSSFDEVSRVFEDKGVSLGINTIRRIAQRFAGRAKIAQRLETIALTDSLGQRRVIVSSDGGRVRIRRNKRGPRTKKGRKRYHTHWKEPKLVLIYTVDDQGKMDHRFIPVIEGTLQGPDTAFGLLRYHLQQLGVHTAKQLLFVADGARWIWNRISELVASLGIAASKVYELVDFYHAVEHLAKVADFKKELEAVREKEMDPKASAHVAQRANRPGNRRDKDFLPGKKKQEYSNRAQLLYSQSTPHGLPKSGEPQPPDWKRCHGKRNTPSGEPSHEGCFHILVERNSRGNAYAAILL